MDAAAQLNAALAGRYEIERELGAGGMATVYLARDVKHDRNVALKVLKPELGAVLGVERFLAEIKVTANLQHPNLLPLFDSGEANGLLFYVMPFVEGESLRARLDREKQLPVEEAVRIAVALASALDYAHRHDVVHRDLKPENILLHEGQPLLADFGIALAVNRAGGARITQTGLSLGTPQYMSPEQASGESTVDARTDIYSLGAVTYEMLAGEPPHTGPTAQAIIARLMTEEPRALAVARPAVPASVDLAVRRALAKVPADRWSTARTFAEALEHPAGAGVASDRVTHSAEREAVQTPLPGPGAEAPATPAITGRWSRRSRLAATLAVVGVAAVASAFAVMRWRGAANAPIDSVAVLPFESVGGDTANVYFAEGMADELSTELGTVPGLHVAARSSSAAVRRLGLTVGQIGARLHVRAVISGTVRRAGDRMRVHAELASAATGLAVWDSSYERGVTDVFAVQDELSRAILGALRLRLTGADAARGRTMGARGTANLEAYDLYLRGMYFYGRRGASLPKAIESFQRALAKDSLFARAWSGMALALSSLAPYDGAADATDLARRADAAARRAVALDSTLPDAHTAMARALMLAGKWHAASGEHEKAIAIDSASPIAHHMFGYFLICCGLQYRRGLDELRTAVRLDPLDASAAGMLAFALILNGGADQAIQVAQRGVDVDSMIGPAQQALLEANYVAGRLAAARAFALRIRPYARGGFGLTAFVLARTGDSTAAKAIVRDFEALPETNRTRLYGLVAADLGLGDTARALSYLEKAAQASFFFPAMFGLPVFDEVRGSPRFGAVMRTYGLDDRVLTSPRGGRP